LKQFLNAREAKTRAEALSELNKLSASNQEAQKLLANAINAANEDVWKSATGTLLERAAAGDAWAVAAYKDALKASRQEVQVEAIKALQKKGTATKSFLTEFAELLTDTDEPVVTAAADALKTLGDDGWPVVKEALASPRPSIRQKGAIVASTMMETTSKHLDDVVARFLVEDAEDVLPELEKLLAAGEGKSLSPMLKGIASIDDVKKRSALYERLSDEPMVLISKAIKPDADTKKPPTITPRCAEIAAAVDDFANAGAKADEKERDKPGIFMYDCMTGAFKGKPEATEVQKKLLAVAQDTKNSPEKRGFALYVVCAGEAPGLDKDAKAWFKDTLKKDPDDKVKSALKKSGCKA
jgi:hypothetical protein